MGLIRSKVSVMGLCFNILISKAFKTNKWIVKLGSVYEIKTNKSFSYLHWESPARDGDHWAAVEVVGELVTVHCGAHEDQTQV